MITNQRIIPQRSSYFTAIHHWFIWRSTEGKKLICALELIMCPLILIILPIRLKFEESDDVSSVTLVTDPSWIHELKLLDKENELLNWEHQLLNQEHKLQNREHKLLNWEARA